MASLSRVSRRTQESDKKSLESKIQDIQDKIHKIREGEESRLVKTKKINYLRAKLSKLNSSLEGF